METGIFSIVEDKPRHVRGMFLPYNELSSLSKSKTPPIRFARGTVKIPRDPMVAGLNIEHERFAPIGRAVAFEDTDAGVIAEFAIADTEEGDAYLADPSKRKLSPELAGIVRRGETGIAARITGGALVSEGAFASAGLFALDEITEELDTTPDVVDGVLTVETTDLPEAVTVTTPEGSAEYRREDTTTAAKPAEQETATMSTAVAPAHAADQAAVEAAKQAGANAVFAAMTTIQNGEDFDGAAEQMLAALSDIKITGSGALPATGVLQPDWVGKLWQGRTYQRKYITLGTQGTIRALDQKGWKLDQGTALVTEWAGNKAALGSGTASTSLVSSVLKKYGFAADIAREFFDIPGGQVFIDAFMAGVIESYSRITDTEALAQIVAAAGTAVAPDTYPTDYPPALGQLIQGIEAIEDANDTPTFAIMNAAAWKQALYTGHEKIPEFVNFSFNTDHTGTADGKVTVVRGNIGITGTPATLVGSKQGIRFNELGTTPIQLDALDIAKGGVDKAVVGYLQTLRERDESFTLIGTPDAP